jgi:hypothetical protein
MTADQRFLAQNRRVEVHEDRPFTYVQHSCERRAGFLARVGTRR